eukprot:6384710-Karenia_brevis.AAC.1
MSWALPTMFGGIQGIGAAEAWFFTGLEIELAMLSETPIIGGVLDLFKCFDQVMRPLLYAVLAIAGLPAEILVAYKNFQEQMCIYNTVNGSLGTPHKHLFGIPQGCPLSMVFIALLLRPWMQQMTSIGAIARTLADDLLLLAKGARAGHLFVRAFHLTMVHLNDLGGRIAPNKSKIFATLAAHRSFLS